MNSHLGQLAVVASLMAFWVSPGHASNSIQAPEDLLIYVPRAFLFSGDYNMKLTVTEMRIDHMTHKSRCTMKKRSCLISLGYIQPVGQALFASRFELPLLSSESISSSWAMASLGDYIVHLSDTPLYSSSLRILASVRF